MEVWHGAFMVAQICLIVAYRDQRSLLLVMSFLWIVLGFVLLAVNIQEEKEIVRQQQEYRQQQQQFKSPVPSHKST